MARKVFPIHPVRIAKPGRLNLDANNVRWTVIFNFLLPRWKHYVTIGRNSSTSPVEDSGTLCATHLPTVKQALL